MTEFELIRKIQKLKRIKPRQDWVILTKTQILDLNRDDRDRVSVISVLKFMFRPRMSVLATLTLLAGLFLLNQFSLPVDSPILTERTDESAQENLISEKNPEFYLGLAQEKIDSLKEIANANNTDNAEEISSEIEKVTENIKKASESIPKTAKNANAIQTEKLVQGVTKIKQSAKELEAIGKDLKIGEQEIQELENKTLAYLAESIEETKNKMAQIVEREVQNLENSSLTDEQEELLEQAKEYLEQENYSEAFIKVWEIQQK